MWSCQLLGIQKLVCKLRLQVWLWHEHVGCREHRTVHQARPVSNLLGKCWHGQCELPNIGLGIIVAYGYSVYLTWHCHWWFSWVFKVEKNIMKVVLVFKLTYSLRCDLNTKKREESNSFPWMLGRQGLALWGWNLCGSWLSCCCLAQTGERDRPQRFTIP